MKMRVSSSRASVYAAVVVTIPIVAFFITLLRSEAEAARKATAHTPAVLANSPGKLSSGQSEARVLGAYGKLPLAFELNMGQSDPHVNYLTRGSGYELFLTPQEAVLALWQPQPPSGSSHRLAKLIRPFDGVNQKASVLRLQLRGANASPEIEGIHELERRANYFTGNDRKNWVTDVPSYERVEYRRIYPGVDLSFYGNQRRLEYDFVVSPGGDSNVIALEFQGSQQKRIDNQGNLILKIPSGKVSFEKPLIYQLNGKGERQEIAGGYLLAKNGEVRFAVSPYDHDRPLVIDPVLNYSTYLGGSASPGDAGLSVAVDTAGNAFVTGVTYSASFPLTTSPATTVGLGTPNAGIATLGGAFVSEIDPTGTKELYFSYLSGDGGEIGNSIAVDPSANTTCMNGVNPGFCVYITGQTFSDDFPVASVVTPYNSTAPTGGAPTTGNAFVTKLNPYVSGATSLLYSSYLASTNAGDLGHGIAVDSSQDAYITGLALSTSGAVPNFPILNGAQTAAPQPAGNAFLTVLKTTASSGALLYSTYLEGNDAGTSSLGVGDIGWAVAVDANKIAYIVGTTPSSDFPNMGSTGTFPNIKGWVSTAPNANASAFVAAVNTTLTGVNSLVYSTYVGGSASELGNGIALGGSGVVYITGQTTSSNFTTTQASGAAGTFPSPASVNGVAFVTKLNTTVNGGPSYSVLLGGTTGDIGNSIQVDGLGNVIVIGTSQSANFPVTPGAFKTALSGSLIGDPFVSKLNPGGNGTADLLYSSYFGGSGATVGSTNFTDQGYGIAVDTLGNAYVTGQTFSTDLPVSAGAFETSLPGGALSAAFVSKLSLIPTVGLAVGSTACSSTAAAPPCSVAFGNQLINTPSAAQNVILTNNTSAAVPVTLPVTVTGANSTDFAAAPGIAGSTPACTASLAPGASCAIQVVFTPTTGASEAASLSVTYTAGVSTNAAAAQLFSLAGTGISPSVTLNPTTTLNFAASQPVGTTSAAQSVTVTNTGNGNLNFTAAPALSGANAGDFAIASGTTCANGGTVIPTANCAINITFTPTATGARTAILTLTDNASNSPQTITITGTGVAAAAVATVTPSAGLAFGNQLVATPSAAQTVTVKNTGNVNLNITAAASFSGTNAADFAIASGTTCTNGAAVTPNSTCVINVTFTPAAAGSRSAALNIADNAAGSPQALALTGTGTINPPAATVSPSTLTFSGQLVTTTSAAQTVTLKNTGGSNLNISVAPSFTGANASDFAVATGTTCTSGAAVAPNATCVINVTFTPPTGAGGSRAAVLNIADNVTGSPQTAAITATAWDFTVTAQPATLTPGSNATIAVAVGSVGGFTGAVTLSCSGTIPQGTCNAPSSPVTAPGSGNVTITTQSSLVPPISTRKPPVSMQQVTLAVFALMLLLALPVARRFRMRLGLAAAAAVLVAVAGCSNKLPTPAGTYPVTITGTSGTVSHAVTVNVTVN